MRTLVWAGLAGLVACGSEKNTSVDSGTPDSGMVVTDASVVTDMGAGPALTYYRDAKPILDGRCVGCHTSGGIAPIDLSIPMLVQNTAALIQIQVEGGTMPPWHAADGCEEYKHNRSLTAEQRQTLIDWVDLGAPLGDPNDLGTPIDPIVQGVNRVDLTIQPEEYTPTRTEDYRCFVVEWPETETKFVTGFNLTPTNPAIVHHANLYLVDAAGVQAFRDKAAADTSGPGYSCFGGAFETGVSLLGAWAPGSVGIEYPEGTGIQVDAGMAVVMEVHFNTGPGRQGADRSQLSLRLEDSVNRRALIAPFFNFFDWPGGGMAIPADEADVVHRYDFDPDGLVAAIAPWLSSRNIQIWGAGMHMHQLGSQGSIRIARGDGSNQCLLEIPRWDFNWQYGYLLEQPIDFIIGVDTFELECHFDNTLPNQPVVEGTRRPVQNRNWGGGSDAEMCIGYVYVTER